MRLAELSAFNTARRHAVASALVAAACGTASLAAIAAAVVVRGAIGSMGAALAASLAITAAGSGAAACMAQARHLALKAEEMEHLLRTLASAPPTAAAPPVGREWFPTAAWLATWGQAGATGSIALCAMAMAGFAWASHGPSELSPADAAPGAGLCFAGAFILLVLERHHAALNGSVFPEAPSLATLLRVAVATFLACGLGCVLAYSGVQQGALAGQACAVLCLAVAAELLLRAVAALFLPFPPIQEAHAVAVSRVAGLLRLDRPRPVAAAVQGWLGIDLSRSWALGYVRTALTPVLAVLTLFGWCLSGVTVLSLDQRGIHERLGRPVAVLGPGLHLHLPWPFAQVRRVEFGVTHDVRVMPNEPPLAVDAAAPPGPSEDRLWDQPHPSEAAYLVASAEGGVQSFESVDIDLRVVYRIGLSDEAAFQSAYAADDPPRLVQAAAARLLAHYFAGRTLPAILRADQANLSKEIGTALQAELDRVPAGLEVMAVVIEAIHPPIGAAAAYHGVQAAQIDAYAARAGQVTEAVRIDSISRRDAAERRNAAAALSREQLVRAQVAATLFAADRQADEQGGSVFLLERRLDRLGKALARRPLLILDHRLSSAGPVIDLRPMMGGRQPVIDESELFAPPVPDRQ